MKIICKIESTNNDYAYHLQKALSDMLVSFSELVSLNIQEFSRPILTIDGPMVFKSARHPIISTLPIHNLQSTFVSNDLYLSPAENMQVITGPNGSGKVLRFYEK